MKPAIVMPTVGAIVVALWVGGCASLLSTVADISGVEVVPETVRQQAYKAASVAFTAWSGPACDVDHDGKPDAVQNCEAGGLQALILQIGHVKRCEVPNHPLICVKQKTWDKIKAIEAKTTKTLQASKPVIEAGTDDVALLMSIPATVYDAKAAIEDAQKE